MSLFYQEMTWTTRQSKSVSVVSSKRLFMAFSAKITPQELPRKFAVMNSNSKKGVRIGWCHATMRGIKSAYVDITWIFQGCKTQRNLPKGWNFDGRLKYCRYAYIYILFLNMCNKQYANSSSRNLSVCYFVCIHPWHSCQHGIVWKWSDPCCLRHGSMQLLQLRLLSSCFCTWLKNMALPHFFRQDQCNTGRCCWGISHCDWL